MTAIFRDNFRKYYAMVFPIEFNNGNIGVTRFDNGKIGISAVWEPPSNIDDKIEDKSKREKLYKDIIFKLNNEQQKELLGYILMGSASK